MRKKEVKAKNQKKKGVPGGERKMAVPAAYGSVIQVGQPVINGSNSITIKHTEYLDDVNSLASFSVNPDVQVYALNPGLITSFPWLGNMAAGYEQYRFKKLAFRYRARSGTGTAGTIYFSTQLDSADPDFASKEEMYAYSGTQSTSPWLDMTHNCLLNRSDYMKKYFVRTGELDSSEDSQLYDSGKFTFVPLQTSAGVFMGELLVDYEVELFNPKMNVADVGAGANFLTAATGTPTSPFAGGLTRALWGAASFVDVSGHSVNFLQSGLFNVSIHVEGSSISPTDDTPLSTTGDVAFSTESFHGTSTILWDWNAWVLVGTAAGATLSLIFAAGSSLAATVKVSSAPLALAGLLGTFTALDADAAKNLGRRYGKKRVRILYVDRKHAERKERAAEEPAGDELPVLARAQLASGPELREDQIQRGWLPLLSRGHSPKRGR